MREAVDFGLSRRAAGKVDLVVDDEAGGGGRQVDEQRQVAFKLRIGADQDRQIGARQFIAGAAHALDFHRIQRIAQASGIDQGHADAVEIDGLAQEVARGPRQVGDDGPIACCQGVEQAGLAGVRTADDDDMQAVGKAYATAAGGKQVIEPAAGRDKVLKQLRCRQEIDLLLGKINRRFDPHAQAHDRFGQCLHATGKFAIEAAHGGACRRLRAAGNQVGDGLGLDQVDLAIEKGTFGKLTRPRLARTEFDDARQQAAEDDRAAMRLQFDDVLAGEGMGRGEMDDQATIQHAAVFFSKRTVMCMAWPWALAEQGPGNGRSSASGEADDADAAGTGGGGNGGDCLGVHVHRHVGRRAATTQPYAAGARCPTISPWPRPVPFHPLRCAG